jgi:hypothetical protein
VHTKSAIRRASSILLIAIFLSGCGAPEEEANDTSDLDSVVSLPNRSFCDAPAMEGFARCHGRFRADERGTMMVSRKPSGLSPADLASAYALSGTGGKGLKIAIIDANDDPNAEEDLAVYRAQYGLPPCTSGNGCFRKVNQRGRAAPLPPPDDGWAGEISLDLDMVSAACPECGILLVEADSASMSNLGAAVNVAARLGASAISNSYGGPESRSDSTYDQRYFHHPSILVTASTGDSGYGVEYPAASPRVLAVGGTKLVRSSNRGWSEAAWTGTGGGCSQHSAKPAWQTDDGCTKRTVADVAAVADPNTGVAVYDSYGSAHGWLVAGGTSAAAPLVAAIFARTGNAAAGADYPYAHASAFRDIKRGKNGTCAGSASYLCDAGPGYDGPTGMGSPIGRAMSRAKPVAGDGQEVE